MNTPAEPPGTGPPGTWPLDTAPLDRNERGVASSLRQFGSGSRQLAGETVVGVRLHPLEAAVVVLMGIGGAVFPPVWLLGAVVATGSKVWDLRDKWTAIAGPLLIVVGGTAIAMVIGGQRHSFGAYTTEAWLVIGRIARIAAVLSASYFLWRLRRGPRPPRTPPWNQPHRLG